jgi:hypothetical protein
MDRSVLWGRRQFKALSPNSWRLADVGATHAFLRSELGWGGMPLDTVAAVLSQTWFLLAYTGEPALTGCCKINALALCHDAKRH